MLIEAFLASMLTVCPGEVYRYCGGDHKPYSQALVRQGNHDDTNDPPASRPEPARPDQPDRNPERCD